MAETTNGTNPKDKVATESKPIPTAYNIEEVNSDLYLTISDFVDKNGVRYLTEGFDVLGVGVVQRDTVFFSGSVSSTVNLLPKVRIVRHYDSNGKKDGFEYIDINATTMDEAGIGVRGNR
tara:strand:- start:76 stop:435 length:360 start_codon:yes stop_codon:yes gene_type:complete